MIIEFPSINYIYRFGILLEIMFRLMNVQIYREKLRYPNKFSKKPGQVYKPEECQDLKRTP